MMNYVGSISILDRGDAPAQAVIDRNARSMAQRISDETKDELEKVMTRVENIYSSFEMSENVYAGSNVEYLQNVGELEEIMKDQVKKKKYQHQVTIFIVGFSEVSGQKLRLLQQVNEFFTENSKKIDEEDWFPTTPDMDLDEVGGKIEDSLHVAQELSKRLSDLHKDMVEYMATYIEKKASNKLTQMMEGKGKKKLEKSLLQAKEEVQTLAEKLLGVQTELQEKEEKLQSTFKQLESKNLEVQKFRTAAELAKKAVQDTEALQEQIAAREAKINEQRQLITRLEIDLAQSNHMTERSQTRLGEESQQKITLIQKELEEQKQMTTDVKRDLTRLYEDQISALIEAHQKELEELKKQHSAQIQSLMEELTQARQELAATHHSLQLQLETVKDDDGAPDSLSEGGPQFDLDSETIDGISRQSSKQAAPGMAAANQRKRVRIKVKESRPSTKEAKSGKKKPSSKSPARTPAAKDGKGSRATGSGAKADKEFGETSTQDEGGDPAAAVVEDKAKEAASRHRRRSRSALEPVHELRDSEDAFALTDEDSWAEVPPEQLEVRFAQYRRLAQQRLGELEEQRQLTIAKTTRKVQQLKAQFVEHKNKWEAERQVLVQQVEQAHRLQTDAEKEADAALTQLEDFITEQERLEEQEEARRSAILRGTSGGSLTPGQTPLPRTPGPPPQTPGTAAASPGHVTPPGSEDLQNLMKQTDDAKVAERNAHARNSGTRSAPPDVTKLAVEGEGKETQGAGATHEISSTSPQDPLHSGGFDASDMATPPLQHAPSLAASGPSSGQEVSRERQATDAEVKGSTSKGEQEVTSPTGKRTEVDEEEEALMLREKSMTLTRDYSTDTSRETEALAGKSPETVTRLGSSLEDELRAASAYKRAHLRDVYRTRLVDARQAAEDRRAHTPHISMPSHVSVDDELDVTEDDQEDVGLPDEMKEELEDKKRQKEIPHYDIGTSPPPGLARAPTSRDVKPPSRKSTPLLEHPVLKEYFKMYEGVVNFKDSMAKSFLDKDMMSASQILADLETLVFDKEKPILQQVEQHTTNVLYVLEEIGGLVDSMVILDREPPVSSLLPLSRDEARSRLPPTREASQDGYPPLARSTAKTASSLTNPDRTYVHADAYMRLDGTSSGGSGVLDGGRGAVVDSRTGSHQSSVSATGKHQLTDLQEQCSLLQQQLQEDSRKHEDQLRHNTVVMMEMQDTINDLQRELSTLGKTAKKPRSASSSVQIASPDMSLMFTRLDLERNAKIMKKAVMDQRLSAAKYKEAVSTMGEYVSLPAQRLAHLVRKYVHHSRMKEIENNVKTSTALDEKVFDTLDKMEALQNQRARKWAEKMDHMGFERLRLAAMLMDSLDNIEEESGLFLIKPMYSFRGRELKAPPTQKMTRPIRVQPIPRQRSAAQESTALFVPAPTPASNIRRLERHTPVNQVAAPTPSRPEDGVVGSVAIRNVGASKTPLLVHPHQTWQVSSSLGRLPKESSASLNTPRMLELDINRMLIGQNNISAKLQHPLTDDRLVNVSNNSLRSYVTVHRPTVPLSSSDQPVSTAGDKPGSAPSSLTPWSAAPVSPTNHDIPQTLNSNSPLPPIGGDRHLSTSIEFKSQAVLSQDQP